MKQLISKTVLLVSFALVTSGADAADKPKSAAIAELLNGDIEIAVGMLEADSANGDREADAYLATLYGYGWGVPSDYAAAKDYAQSASQGGVAAATLMLFGDFNEKISLSIVRDAKRQASKDAKKGDALSQYFYARTSERDTGAGQYFSGLLSSSVTGDTYDPNNPTLPDNYLWKKSRENYKLAAKQGFAPAMHSMGILRSNGRGFDRDDAKALAWLERAVARQFSASEFMLGLAQITGKGAPQDQDAGITLLRRAANRGHHQSANALGVIYRDGYGVPVDNSQALALFDSARGYGNQDAVANYNALSAKMVEEQARLDAEHARQQAAIARQEAEESQRRTAARRRQDLEDWRTNRPDVVALAEAGAQGYLDRGAREICGKHGIVTGKDFLWAQIAHPPNIAPSDIRGKAEYSLCLSMVGAVVGYSIMLVDVDSAKRDRVLPIPEEAAAKRDAACGGSYSQRRAMVESTYTSIEQIFVFTEDCLPEVLSQIATLVPYQDVSLAAN